MLEESVEIPSEAPQRKRKAFFRRGGGQKQSGQMEQEMTEKRAKSYTEDNRNYNVAQQSYRSPPPLSENRNVGKPENAGPIQGFLDDDDGMVEFPLDDPDNPPLSPVQQADIYQKKGFFTTKVIVIMLIILAIIIGFLIWWFLIRKKDDDDDEDDKKDTET